MASAEPSLPSSPTTIPVRAAVGLASLDGPRRLALASFLVLMGGFYLLAQVKLATAAGAGALPGPEQVLFRYHGDPKRSKLHVVLDPSLSTSDPKRMFDMDGASEEVAAARRLRILAWVEQGAPRAGWGEVAASFSGDGECGKCHSARPDDEGRPRSKANLPFDAYEQVLPMTRPGEGMSLHELATSSHNHLFGFAIGALALSLIFVASRWRGPLVPALVAGSFSGAAIDVGSWWLTRAAGSPWEWGVILGGGLFGACAATMAVLSLDELVARSALARVLAPVLSKLRLARLDG